MNSPKTIQGTVEKASEKIDVIYMMLTKPLLERSRKTWPIPILERLI